MKYFFAVFCLAIFTILVVLSGKNKSTDKMDELIIPEDIAGGLDSFTKNEAKRAIYHAHQEYGTPQRITLVHEYKNAAKDAVDVVKERKFFTKVLLSKNSDTLYLYPMAFKETKSKEKGLYEVIMDELVGHKLANIDNARRH